MATVAECIQRAIEIEEECARIQAQRIEAEVEEAKRIIAEVIGEVWQELGLYIDEGHPVIDQGAGRLRYFWYWVDPPDMARFAVACWPGQRVEHIGFQGVYLVNVEPEWRGFLGVPVRGIDEIAGFLYQQRKAFEEGNDVQSDH